MHATIPLEPTVGEIARRIGCPKHRVEYLIRARNVTPKGRAGNARVFREADIQYISCYFSGRCNYLLAVLSSFQPKQLHQGDHVLHGFRGHLDSFLGSA